MSDSITVSAPPTTADVSVSVLAAMSAQSGVATDFTTGSQIRTLSEAIGSVAEMEAIAAQALAFQAALYSAYYMAGITPLFATFAAGTVTFSTVTAATQTAVIPVGTVVATVGGVQFATTSAATIAIGATSVSVTVSASAAGATGNVTAGTITQILSGLAYGPLTVTNAAPTAGGANAESPAQTLARYTASVAAIPAGSPVAIANSCIGVSVASTNETVYYATVYEPWISQVAGGSTTPTIGFTVYIDNGSGAASTSLLNAVTAKINPTLSSGSLGYRNAGVPYGVDAVTPLACSVTITGVATTPTLDPSLDSLAEAAAAAYFAALGFEATAEQSQLNAAVANATAGFITGLTVTLYNASSTAVSTVTAAYNQRIIPTTISTVFS